MSGLPEISMAGTLTADPELRFTPSGVAVASFTVACNDRRYNRDSGQWEDAGATFLRCTVWREFAENVSNSLNRGARVIVTGSLKQSSWQDKNTGENRYGFDVDVTEVGPSLRWATATVNKANRSNGLSGDHNRDPWSTAAPAPSATAPATTSAGSTPGAASAAGEPAAVGTGRFTDEPPF